MLRKFVAFLLSLTLLCSFSISALAATSEVSSDSTTEDFNYISEETACYIAQFFLSDALSLSDVEWDETTEVIDCVNLYDTTGSEVVAYNFNLTTGYIVVSAYSDVPNVILEWSDQTGSLCEQFDLQADDKIIYTGTLNYYQDSGNDTLTTLDNELIERASISDDLEQFRAEENSPMYSAEDSIALASTISDPFAHASKVYGGTYTCSDYCNEWEGNVSFCTTADFNTVNGKNYYDHCGPTAITNLLRTFATKYSKWSIINTTPATMFETIAQFGLNHLYYSSIKYKAFGGTFNYNANEYIKDAAYLYSVRTSVDGQYAITYDNVKNSLSDGDLLYLMLTKHSTYGDHHLLCFAYTRLYTSATNRYKTYLKVSDGWSNNSSGNNRARYIDLATVDSNDKYWAVSFPGYQ